MESPHHLLTRTPPHMMPDNIELSPISSSPALSPNSTTSATAKKNEPPKRLRHWLIDMIDSGEILGLQWEDSSRTIFRIPWKHAGKNNWTEDDCKIFQAWAEHRGKYKKGDKIDPATWKTRLRCALNKLGDIKELKDRSNLEGNNPYRVYKLLPEQDKAQEPEIYPRESWPRESSGHRNAREYADYAAYQHQQNIRMMSSTTIASPPQDPPRFNPHRSALTNTPFHDQNTVPQGFGGNNKYEMNSPSGFVNSSKRNPLGLAYEPSQVLNQVPSPLYNQEALQYKMDTGGFDGIGFQQDIRQADYDIGGQYLEHPPSANEMDIVVYYRGKSVLREHVCTPTGCRIYHGDGNLQLIAMQTHQLPSGVFGSDSLHQIGLVGCEKFSVSQKQASLTNHVLNNIKRGLILFYENGCFYMKRLCQSRVFLFGPESAAETPEKVERHASLKVFDFKNFHSKLERYVKEGRAKLPEIEVKVSFGQNWSIKTPFEKNLVTLCMIPSAAQYYISKVRQQYKLYGSLLYNDSLVDCGGPDSLDRLADRATCHLDHSLNRLLDDVLLNLDPELIRPFSETPDPRPFSNETPITSSSQTNNGYNPNDLFQRNVIPIAPISSFANDVEMM